MSRRCLPTFARALLAAGALLAACGGPPDPLERVELRFVDFVGHQRLQVTTRGISADRGSDLLGAGWRRIDRRDGPAAGDGRDIPAARGGLELAARGGRLRFFSAGAATRGVELELADPLPVIPRARLNGRPLGRLRPARDRQTFRAEFPPAAVRDGWNDLWLVVSALDEAGATPASVAVAEIRFLPATPAPAPAPADGSPRIRAGAPDEERFSMPGDSYLDMVARLPAEARWAGRFDVAMPAAGQPVTVSAELLDAAGGGHELWRRTYDRPASGESFRLSLERWARQLTRLRLRVTGGAGAEVRWAGARITGEGRDWTPPVTAADGWRRPPRSGRLGRPDVFLVLLDAARADAFGCYGSQHPTPAVDALARLGTRFANAQAPSSWTAPSVPAALSGLYPDTLGIEHWGNKLPPDVGLVQEMARDAGYHTVLWSQHPIYDNHRQLRRGFAEYRRNPQGRRQALPEGPELLREDRPTFAVIHLLPPHAPYEPPPPFRGAYTSDYRGSVPVDARFLNSFPGRRQPEELSSEDREYIHGRYLETAAFADSLVGRLVDLLKREGRFDDALFIVFSDHGEGFLEHRHFLHCRLLYGEFLRVPLVIKWPAAVEGFEPVVEAPVSLVDLTPSLVDGLALDSAGRRYQGVSLLPYAFDGEFVRRGLYAVTRGASRARHRPWPSAAVSLDGWKLIVNLESQEMELYHLASDPGEGEDRAAAEPARAQLLRQLFYRQRHLNAALRAGLGAAGEHSVDPEISRQLRALGYL